MNTTKTELSGLSDLGPVYQDYAYGYPHKTAYRTFDPGIPLERVWRHEDTRSLFLYVHIPFCEMRCGFCNLFTTANAREGVIEDYLDTFSREIVSVKSAIGEIRPLQLAIGGGTPTVLQSDHLRYLFNLLDSELGVSPQCCGTSIETSPGTATTDRLDLINELGVERVSIGVQSFDEQEAREMGRPQKTGDVLQALENIKRHNQLKLNVDLIYGTRSQTPESFRRSIDTALDYDPDEMYLYPLYIRQLTGLDNRLLVADTHRLDLYRAGRAHLLDRGFEQISMRHFRKPNSQSNTGLEFNCQEDAMLGLGCGARSYTSSIHYSAEYAVGRAGVLDIIDNYRRKSVHDFSNIHHGICIDSKEQARRFVLKSVLNTDGLDLIRYSKKFGNDVLVQFPILCELQSLGLFSSNERHLYPTELGLAYSDAIPPLFYSDRVRALMNSTMVV